jgi:hypothetical protein
MEIIKQLTEKYNLSPNSYCKQNIWRGEPSAESVERYNKLKQKWQNHVGKGWYGFSLERMPVLVYDVIDEFLDWLKIEEPNFEIHQIKQKFSYTRIHIGSIKNSNFEVIHKLEDLLVDKNFQY